MGPTVPTSICGQFYLKKRKSTVNWVKFGVKILLLVQPTTKIKLMKIFDSVNFQYACDVHTKTAVLKALLLTLFTAGT